MISMRFDYRDLFRAPRIAWSFQRIWIQFLGLLSGWLVYFIFTYLALLLAGENMGVLWARFGLIPSIAGLPLPWYAWVSAIIGLLGLLFFWLVSATAVARAVYMNLKGNHFYTWKDAIRFALKKKGGSVIATPIGILAIAFFTGLGGVIVGLCGRIPVVGEIGIALFTLIWFAASLFLVFLALALGVSLFLTPSVLATTDDDAFEGIFQSFSTLVSQPWRLIVYTLLVGVLAILGGGVFAYFAKKAWFVMNRVLTLGMGDKCIDVSYAASYLLQNWIYPAVEWARALPSSITSACFFGQEFLPSSLGVSQTIAAYVMAIFLLLIGLAVVAYPVAIFNTGYCLLFLILKKKKDDENLLERKDKEEPQEEVKVPETPPEKPQAEQAKPKARRATSARKAPAKKTSSRKSR